MKDSSRFVSDLVAACIERRETEGDAAIEDICAANPEHAEAIRKRLRRLADMGLLAEPEEAAPAVHALPETIAGYRLLRRLGEGGMGVVHLARHERLGRRVALKLVRPDQLWFPGARRRFAREAELVAALNHPGIVPLYEVGEEGGLPWLSMEFVEGATLEDLVRAFAGRDPGTLHGRDLERVVREKASACHDAEELEEPGGARSSASSTEGGSTTGSTSTRGITTNRAMLFDLPWTEAVVRIAQAAAEALAHAHAQGVLHRDIKPSNVIVSVDGRVRLLDFGLAVGDNSSKLTATGQLLGSMAYMPPERLRTESTSLRDPRSDVYSLGATLFELLTLRTPFVADSSEGVRRQILETRAPSPRPWNRAVTPDLAAVCLVALDPDPRHRYTSMDVFAADLQRLLCHEPVLARPPSGLRRVVTWAQRRPATAAALMLGVTLLVGGPTGYALLADQHAGELKDALDRTEAERDIATLQTRRAEANLDLARGAVDTLLVEVSDTDLDNAPGMEALRRKLRVSALGFYQSILEQRPEQGELALRRLHILSGVGSTHADLGNLDEARESFATLATEADALLGAGPPTGDAWTPDELDRLRRFQFEGRFGSVDTNLLSQGDQTQRAVLERAVDTARARAAVSPDDTARYDLARALGVQAVSESGHTPDAEVSALFDEALLILERLTPSDASTTLDPASVFSRRMELLYSVMTHLVEFEREAGPQLDRHLDVVQRGVRIQDELERFFGDDELPLLLRQERSMLFSGMAHSIGKLGRPREAEQLHRLALADIEAVIAVSPGRYFPWTFLAGHAHELAMQISRNGRRPEAIELLRPIVPRLLEAHRNWPDIDPLRDDTALVIARLGLFQLQSGQLDDARRTLADLLGLIEEIGGIGDRDAWTHQLQMGYPLIDGALAAWQEAELEAEAPRHVEQIVTARDRMAVLVEP